MARMLTVKEVCEHLQIHRTTAYRLMEHGHLPYVRIGRQRRIEPKALEAFKSAHLVGSG